MSIFSDTLVTKAIPLADDDPRFIAIAEQFGGVATMNAKRERFHRAVLRLNRERPALKETYPDQWVAMGADGVAGTAASHEALLDVLKAKGIPAGDVVTALLNTKPRMLIL